MPRFRYRARRGPSRTVEGVVEASSREEAVSKLAAENIVPYSLEPLGSSPAVNSVNSSRAGNSQLIVMTRQMADLVGSGVPLLQSLGVVIQQSTNPRLRGVLEQVYTAVEEGDRFSDAMARHPSTFTNLYVSMVRAGELSGNLEGSLEQLALLTESDAETKSRIQLALAYPLLVAGFGVLAALVMLVFVVPQMVELFEDMGQVLPLPTRILLAASGLALRYGPLVLILGILAWTFREKIVPTQWLRGLGVRSLQALPWVGKLVQRMDVARVTRAFATLLSSRVPVLESAEIVSGIAGTPLVQEGFREMAARVGEGASIAEALRKHPVFPAFMAQMVAVGEEVGTLDKALLRVASSFEWQTDREIKMLTALLEPLMILIVAVIIAFMVVAILLPIFQMNLMVA
ncbi:MAG: type II secretion system F family protein [Candidatus Omnitrophica bacterium]|nr:type II secretion system F family protein [Candidatus Omnitrophota bacterium]